MKTKKFHKICFVLVLAGLLAACSNDLLETLPGTKGSTVIAVSSLASAVTQTTATVTWTTAVAATHYVEYGIASGTYTGTTVPSTAAATSHSVTLSGLTAGTTYYYRVTNIDGNNASSAGTESSFTTTAATPVVVTPVTHPTLEEKLAGIWVVGGLSGSLLTSTVADVDLYVPATDTWYQAVTRLDTPVSFAGICSLGGKIYVFGGFDASGNVQDKVQIYDVATNAWTAGTNLPLARANIEAVVTSGKIYLLGGTSGNATTWGLIATGFSTYQYTPGAGSPWTTMTTYSATALANRTAVAFNDTIQNFGGRSAAATMVATHDGYSTSVPTYLTSATEVVLPAIRTGMARTVYVSDTLPAMIVVVGGISTLAGTTGSFIFQGAGATTAMTNTVQFLYYPFSSPSSWQTASVTYPLSVGFPSGALNGSKFYVFGGTSSGNSPAGLSNGYYLDLTSVSSGTWTATTIMPTGRYGHTAVAISQ